MHSEINVRFTIKGDFDPDEVSRRIGLVATQSWRRGDPAPNAPLLRRDSDLWMITSSKGPQGSLDEQVRDLMKKLAPRSAAIAREASKGRAALFVGVWSYGGDRPELGFDERAVEWLASVHAGIDIDLYVLSDEEPTSDDPAG